MRYNPDTIGDAVLMFVRKNYRSSKEAAHEFGISQSYLSAMIHGTRPPNSQVLRDMGYTLAYVPAEKMDSSMFALERRISTDQSSNTQHVGAQP